MNNNPLVSVIIPVYNREDLIEKSIRSVLNQTYKNLEVIVVDDASTDRTSEKILGIRDERIRYYKNEKNLGPSGSRNRGIELAKGELIAFQDSDDNWFKEKLEKQVDVITHSSEVTAAVYCRIEFIDYKTGKKKVENYDVIKDKNTFAKGTRILSASNQTVLIKKTVLAEVGYFDERMKFGEDTEMTMRVTRKYSYAFVDEPLVTVTRNHDQLTQDSREYIAGREIIYSKHKDFLSNTILYNMCKQIANYYVLTSDYNKGKKYLKESLKYKRDLATILLLWGISSVPSLIGLLYDKKYKGKLPVYSSSNKF